jgi:hypothetical protein
MILNHKGGICDIERKILRLKPRYEKIWIAFMGQKAHAPSTF